MLYRHRLLLTSMTTVALTVVSVTLAATIDRSVDTSLREQSNAVEDHPATDLHDQLNAVMGLSRSTLLELSPEELNPSEPFTITLPIADVEHTIHLAPHSVRATDFRVHKQLDDGSLQEVDPGIERTVRGQIINQPGALVAGSVLPDGLHLAVIFPEGSSYWVEPARAHLGKADPSHHVLYDIKDADCDKGTCGVPPEWQQAHHAPQGFGGQMPISSGSGTCYVAQLAIDADYHYFQQLGSNVNNVVNNISNIIATVNIQYENQVGIVHEVTEIVVRTSLGSNPYTSNNAGTLLNQFRNVWTSSPELSIPRDLAHLFTGRNLNGGTLGVAWLSTVCSSPFGQHYALSQRLSNTGCMTDLVAHEIGHNWSAQHCSCPFHTMNPSLTCANNFSSQSISAITAFRDAVNCLEPCIPPPPSNNTCDTVLLAPAGSTPVSTVGATTDGHPESQLCSGNGDIQSDVWFATQAQCAGELTLSLCDAEFPARMAVYTGQCPTGPDQAIACNTSSCSDSNQPKITLEVDQFEVFWIRIGSASGEQGAATLQINCEPFDDPSCPADIAGPNGEPDGAIDVFDLLKVIGEWGACSDPDDCPADVTGPEGEPDGTVDVFDLLKIIGEWGSCPDG